MATAHPGEQWRQLGAGRRAAWRVHRGLDLEILNGAAVVRTVSGLATASFLYTAAMLAADFGGPVTTLRFRVYQIGALGRGAVAEALV